MHELDYSGVDPLSQVACGKAEHIEQPLDECDLIRWQWTDENGVTSWHGGRVVAHFDKYDKVVLDVRRGVVIRLRNVPWELDGPRDDAGKLK